METPQISEWQSIGRITFEEEKLSLPEGVPTEPGLYRLEFENDRFYVGEASDIRRRLGDYLFYHPSVGIESEQRIYKALVNSHGANVYVLRGESFATRSARCIREYDEIRKLKSDKKEVLNGGNLEDRIAFHESEAKRLREKLELRNIAVGGKHE